MTKYDQDDTSSSIDEMTKKMESYFLSTQEEIKRLRAEIVELTRILKSQRMFPNTTKQIGASSISDLLSNKHNEI